ncbi:DUF4145 domain-containing protein [Xanthobacter autotrophicus]|uniref:DUF4145 domain-containing protein n=1 Tax=Xanthobacter autotrophicus TaxID=280 RepID=UPI00372AA401
MSEYSADGVWDNACISLFPSLVVSDEGATVPAEAEVLASCDNKRKANCAKCGGIRNCNIRGHYDEKGGDEDFLWSKNWYILQCCGCDYVFLQTVSTNSEDYHQFYERDDSEGIEYIETIGFWPVLSNREKPEWVGEFGIDAVGVDKLEIVLIELYGALDSDLKILSGIGMRTAFDVAAESLGVDASKSFEGKLESLVSEGHIGIVDKDRLGALVDAGNASAHRGWIPTALELNTMMDILEHFIYSAFVAPARAKALDEKARLMKAGVPARKRSGVKKTKGARGGGARQSPSAGTKLEPGS